MRIIAHVHTDYPTKFGIPRQSGLVGDTAKIVFLPEYRIREAFRGLESFSHLWILWKFSQIQRESWSPTVRPPKLGGNRRVGVFATRSPYRPNPIGLSSVQLIAVEYGLPESPVLVVKGADMADGTPVYDVKPYLAYTDSHPEATGGFSLQRREGTLSVQMPPALEKLLPEEKRAVLKDVLAQDPRPAYQNDPQRVYGFSYADFEIKFRVEDDVLTVLSVTRKPS